MPQDLERLVRRAQDGDPAALRQLYMKYAPLVRTFCFERIRDWHVTCDITQEVFLAVLEGVGTLKQAQRFKPWLLGILRYKIAAYLKQEVRKTQRCTGVVDELAVGAFEPAEQDMLERLQEAIAELPEVQRIAVRLFHLEGVAVREIVELLGVPMRTVYAALARARIFLEQRLAKH